MTSSPSFDLESERIPTQRRNKPDCGVNLPSGAGRSKPGGAKRRGGGRRGRINAAVQTNYQGHGRSHQPRRLLQLELLEQGRAAFGPWMWSMTQLRRAAAQPCLETTLAFGPSFCMSTCHGTSRSPTAHSTNFFRRQMPRQPPRPRGPLWADLAGIRPQSLPPSGFSTFTAWTCRSSASPQLDAAGPRGPDAPVQAGTSRRAQAGAAGGMGASAPSHGRHPPPSLL